MSSELENAASQQWTRDEVRGGADWSFEHPAAALVVTQSHVEVQDDKLRRGVRVHSARQWKLIADFIKSRTAAECHRRWRELQSGEHKAKRPWCPAEDNLAVDLVKKYGTQQWTVIASHISNRTAKQCRERCVSSAELIVRTSDCMRS